MKKNAIFIGLGVVTFLVGYLAAKNKYETNFTNKNILKTEDILKQINYIHSLRGLAPYKPMPEDGEDRKYLLNLLQTALSEMDMSKAPTV